jgi:hypothetical protein
MSGKKTVFTLWTQYMSDHLKVFLLMESVEIYLESILGTISLLILLPLKEQYHGSMKKCTFTSKLVKS